MIYRTQEVENPLEPRERKRFGRLMSNESTRGAGEDSQTLRLPDLYSKQYEKEPPGRSLTSPLSSLPLPYTTRRARQDMTRHDTCAQIYFYPMSDYCFIYDLYIPTLPT